MSYFPGDMESLVDKEITVKGYFVGGGTHYQIVAVNVDGKDITEAVETAEAILAAATILAEKKVQSSGPGFLIGLCHKIKTQYHYPLEHTRSQRPRIPALLLRLSILT